MAFLREEDFFTLVLQGEKRRIRLHFIQKIGDVVIRIMPHRGFQLRFLLDSGHRQLHALERL